MYVSGDNERNVIFNVKKYQLKVYRNKTMIEYGGNLTEYKYILTS